MIRTTFKFFVLAALVVGGAALLAGPDRLGAVFDQVRHEVDHHIDAQIDDPVALRLQLHKLDREYPARIAAVRGDLAELREQMRQLRREAEVAKRVVELASADREDLRNQLAAAESSHGDGRVSTATLRIDDTPPRNSRLRIRLDRVQRTVGAYVAKAHDAERDLGYLAKQEERLQAILDQLESEHAQFRAQTLQLDRQVDAVARNERLIELMNKRQRTIEEVSRYEAGNLDQIQGRLAEVRARQEAELEALSGKESATDYEDRARFEIDMGESLTPVSALPGFARPRVDPPLEVEPGDPRRL